MITKGAKSGQKFDFQLLQDLFRPTAFKNEEFSCQF